MQLFEEWTNDHRKKYREAKFLTTPEAKRHSCMKIYQSFED